MLPEKSTLFASPVMLAVMCYGVWGFAPLAYMPITAFGGGSVEIIGHRALWAMIWATGLVLATRQFPEVWTIFKQPKLLGILLISSLMVAINWGVFVWAVTNGHTIESSLGYYLNPLINMAAGAMLFKERLDGYGKAAIGAAVVGVLIQAFAIGHIPWVALILAVSFATYGIIRKQVAVNALPGLLVECMYLFPVALVFLVWFEQSGRGHFFDSPWNAFWFAFTGPITVLPLALFSFVARRLPLSTMGFIQFIAPTIAFCIGLFQGETFTFLRGVSFAFIWGGAMVFAFGAWQRLRAVTTT
ncbi:EamA family transporter RarD [Asticcacaulis sp. AC402]|uniref:EamA family transporter RarD n=1 Tax=Asticcacaulis sp. AC402 TaxID=1282361 RepID=UPI0003F79C5C|nr:EamA family transporter RarD [Asticcacaulis sp. AC402]